MGEEARIGDYGCDGGGNEDRVVEWEEGLPSADDLTPLSQALIPPELASAFRISPEPYRTMLDVNRASQSTFSSLRGGHSQTLSSSPNNLNLRPLNDERNREQISADDDTDPSRDGSESKKARRIEFGGGAEEAESPIPNENASGDDPSGKTQKRPRLVWTPQLHKRFVDVVAHLGIKNAVPKTIMQLMNVEGLTRENVASHLQKYRLYLKRMQGLSNDGPSSSDHLFASTPVPPQTTQESGGSSHQMPPIPIPFPALPQVQMMPMPVIGMPAHGHNGHFGNPNGGASNGFHHLQYNLMQQRGWAGSRYGAYHNLSPAD